MRKSIFSKMMTIYIVVLLISFSVTAVGLFYSTNRYMVGQKETLLGKYGLKTVEVLEVYAENQSNALALFFFQRSLETFSYNTSSVIWVVDKDGFIVAASEIPSYVKGSLIRKNNIYKLTDERQYSIPKNTNKGYTSEIGRFYGLFSKTNMAWLTVKVPFLINGNRISGVILLYTPVPEIRKAGNAIFKLFLITGSVAALVSVFLIYFFSKRFSKPLKKMSQAAKIIASGKFTDRLNLSSQDELGQLAQSFNQMVDGLENLERMRREFVANVSHELRTPMTSIKGFIEGILDGTIPKEQHSRYLMIVKNEVKRLNKMVNELLDLAKMEAGEVKIHYEEFDVNEMVRICVIELEQFILEKNLTFKADFEQEVVMVVADPDAIKRVFINLLHNAIKFTPNGGTISVRTRVLKDKVKIFVEDTGEGIDSEEIKFIFERFHKTDKSRSKDTTGVGLGLAIVKNIVQLHGQDIYVESEKGSGTRFIFTLARN